jgi:hypothetical protein
MKNYIKINQGNLVKISKEKGIKVDAVDGVLFDWIATFMLSGKALKKLIDNELYIWVSYKKIREDNPLCHISSNDVVGRRLNKLVELGILKKYLSKEDGNKVFFAITKFAHTYLLLDRELPTFESGGLPTFESGNSKLIDSKLKDNKEATTEEDVKSAKQHSSTSAPISKKEKKNKLIVELEKKYKPLTEEELHLAEDFISYRKQLKSSIRTHTPIKAYLENIVKTKEITGLDVEEIIEIMKEREWKTVKPEYYSKYISKQHNITSQADRFNTAMFG